VLAPAPDINIIHTYLGIGILLPDIGCLLEGSHATHRRAAVQMVFVPGTGTLYEGNAVYLFTIRGPYNFSPGGSAGRCKPLHDYVGNNVGEPAVTIVTELLGIIGLPAGGPYNRPYIKFHGFWLHIKLNGFILADLGALAAAGLTGLGVDNIFHRKGKGVSHVNSLCFVKTIVKIV